jgi:hypothetical protein
MAHDPGKLPGAPTANGTGLQVNPGGATIYDPTTNITWLANANLVASNVFGLAGCTSPTAPSLCVAQDGAMTWNSAVQYIANRNTASYLGQTNWQAPTIAATCPGYGCDGADNPMGNLFYDQLGLHEGTAAVNTPNISVGPFHNFQPRCEFRRKLFIRRGLSGYGDLLANSLFVNAYFVGARTSGTGPEVFEVANAEGEKPVIRA